MDAIRLGDHDQFNLYVQVLNWQPGPFGTFVWQLGNRELGSPTEPVFLWPFLNGLDEVAKTRHPSNSEALLLGTSKFLEMAQTATENYRFPSTEGLDDYHLFFFNDSIVVRVVAQRVNDHLWMADASVPTTYVQNLVSELRSFLHSASNN